MHEGAHAPLLEYRIFIHVFLLLQIQQVTLLLRPSTWKLYASLVAVSCLSLSLVSYISTRHEIHSQQIHVTSSKYHKKILSYANLTASLSGREFRKCIFCGERRKSHMKTANSFFSSVPSDFKWSFLYFVQLLASIYIYCETREVEIFLFCFSCRVNRWIG